jgi:hypothetical protein
MSGTAAARLPSWARIQTALVANGFIEFRQSGKNWAVAALHRD